MLQIAPIPGQPGLFRREPGLGRLVLPSDLVADMNALQAKWRALNFKASAPEFRGSDLPGQIAKATEQFVAWANARPRFLPGDADDLDVWYQLYEKMLAEAKQVGVKGGADVDLSPDQKNRHKQQDSGLSKLAFKVGLGLGTAIVGGALAIYLVNKVR
jgi:hypothetical protein